MQQTNQASKTQEHPRRADAAAATAVPPTATLRPANARGHVQMGWLDSHHTFSFGGYYDRNHMGHGPLRVINDDRVVPGAGFPTHGHRDMEILSYVVQGGLAHKDSEGHGGVVRPGEVQIMSAGHGIRHSEFNASETEGLRFLQIWIEPAQRGTAPSYVERDFGRAPGVTLLASPDARDGSLPLGQDVDVYRVLLDPGTSAALSLRGSRGWVQVATGAAEVGAIGAAGATTALREGDGLALTGITSAPELTLTTQDTAVEALIFDLP